MKKLICLLTLVMLVSGCATIYQHPTKTAEDFERDQYECEMLATRYTADMGFSGNPLIIAGEMKRCLQKKYGWTPVQK